MGSQIDAPCGFRKAAPALSPGFRGGAGGCDYWHSMKALIAFA